MPKTPQQRIGTLYGFDFPDDFFRFREFLKTLPKGLLRDVCDMSSAYPFSLAGGKKPAEFPDNPLWEDRYYHDLPEFVTVLHGHCDGLHFGYFFDAPGELPPVVAHYWHSDTFQHAFDGDTLFEALRWHVEQAECDCQEAVEGGEEDEEYGDEKLAQAEKLRRLLRGWWGNDRPETGSEYMDAYEGSAWRAPVASTFDDLGIVLDSGRYKPLTREPLNRPNSDPKPEAVERAAKEAMRNLEQGFPGTALKLGRDLWVWAKDFPVCYELLDAAYAALGREPLRRLTTEARAWRTRCDELPAKRGK